MKLTADRNAFLKVLSHVQSVVERKNTIPILSNILLEAADGKALLTATDMDLEVMDSVSVTVEEAGKITVPAHTLYEIVRKIPDGASIKLQLSSDGNLVTLSSGKSHFKLGCIPANDFPKMSSGDLPVKISLKADDVKKLIDRTRFAISTEETRYYLNGIYLHTTNGESGTVLRAVATDGHRLARVEVPVPDTADTVPGIIIPRKAIAEIRKAADEAGDTPIEFQISETKVRVQIGNLVLTSKLIDGTFPDYDRVIPANNDKKLIVAPLSFIHAVDRVATISTEKARAVKLAIKAGLLTIHANSPDSGSATEEIEIEYDSTPLDIGFNARYLMDIVQQMGTDTCQFSLSDAGSPTIIKDLSDSSSLYVIMPMRV